MRLPLHSDIFCYGMLTLNDKLSKKPRGADSISFNNLLISMVFI